MTKQSVYHLLTSRDDERTCLRGTVCSVLVIATCYFALSLKSRPVWTSNSLAYSACVPSCSKLLCH